MRIRRLRLRSALRASAYELHAQSCASVLEPSSCDRLKPVTIASVRAHGVRQLLVYRNGKREGDWDDAARVRNEFAGLERHRDRIAGQAPAEQTA